MGEQIQMSATQIQDFTQTTRTARDDLVNSFRPNLYTHI